MSINDHAPLANHHPLTKSTPDPPAPPATPPALDRRRFLRRALGGGVAVATGVGLYAWRLEPHWIEVVRQPLAIAGLPAALVGKRLVQLSDIHAGPDVDQSYLIAAAEGVAELKPDMIAITGDFMSSFRDESIPPALDVIRALPAAPLGRFAALGNHDYGYNWRQDAVANKITAGLEQLDVQVLRNQVVNVDGLQIAGLEDFYTRHFDANGALGRLRNDCAAIALCHNPDAADRPEWRDFQGWILAGHTHGGQCKAPFLRPPKLPVWNKRYVAGVYELAAGRSMYINRGLGHLLRVRFNCRPEITLFTLAAR